VINMAHGELIMVGAYTPFVLQTEVGLFAGASATAFVLAIPAAFVAAGIIGVAMERLLLRRMYDRPLDTLLVTFGVALLLQQAAKDRFGAANVNVTAPSWLTGRWSLAGVVMPHTRLFIMAMVVVTLFVISVVLAKTATGRRMRAVMENRDLAAVSGLANRQVDMTTFFIGSGLAGLAGVAVALIGAVGFQIGLSYIIDAFLVVIVGGLGKLRGAFIAAMGIGLLNSFAQFWTDASIAKAIVFACVIVFLQFRPNGLVSFRSRGLTT
jgi:urea transport system permease protein